MERSTAYKAIATRTLTDYTVPPTHPMTVRWFERIAPMWRNRVGIPRLTAEAALFEALGLVRSINRGVFAGRTDEREAYDKAVESLADVAQIIARENWRRFDRTEDADV